MKLQTPGSTSTRKFDMTRTVTAIRHVAFEDLGAFEAVFLEMGMEVLYFDVGLDDLSRLDPGRDEVAVVLGGPIGAYDHRLYPFLSNEIAYIEKRIAQSLPTIGICLGAQLMALSLGVRVYPAAEKEIGFFPVELTPEGKRSCLAAVGDAAVLHWHGDTFDLPKGAIRLASTRVCKNQAFSYGQNAIAFQFHPEVGVRGFERWLIGHALELATIGVDVNELRSEHESARLDLERRARECLRNWITGLT
jgi:GMP synthase (glutamine-hydrolysing)